MFFIFFLVFLSSLPFVFFVFFPLFVVMSCHETYHGTATQARKEPGD